MLIWIPKEFELKGGLNKDRQVDILKRDYEKIRNIKPFEKIVLHESFNDLRLFLNQESVELFRQHRNPYNSLLVLDQESAREVIKKELGLSKEAFFKLTSDSVFELRELPNGKKFFKIHDISQRKEVISPKNFSISIEHSS